MSVLCRFCCRSRLKASANNDSLTLTRSAAGTGHDGSVGAGPRTAVLFVLAYSDNYLIDVKVGIIMDVEASRAIRQAEVGASKTMIERTQERFDIKPERLAGDTAYSSGANLHWLVKDQDIAPHIPVIDNSKREDRNFSR